MVRYLACCIIPGKRGSQVKRDHVSLHEGRTSERKPPRPSFALQGEKAFSYAAGCVVFVFVVQRLSAAYITDYESCHALTYNA